MAFSDGQRVRVRQDRKFPPGPWPAEPTGHITPFADGQLYRVVATVKGEQRMWFVTFDQPQRDADGDGPYASSEVLERYLDALN